MTDIISPNTIIKNQKVQEPFVYSPAVSTGIDIRVAQQFPNFVSEDHPRFIEFMEAYYEWMQGSSGVFKKTQSIKNQQDIDTAEDVFEEQLFKEFLANIPRNILANSANVLKHIKQFYKAKGTEKSYSFLFRLLFNTKVNLYYPKVDILKLSDGKWIKNKTIRIINFSGDPASLKGKKIIGTTSNTSAFVEKVLVINEGVFSGYELFFNISSISGNFYLNEVVISEDNEFSASISPVPTDYKIISPGKNYKIGDSFDINRGGYGARVKVAEIDSDGGVLSLEIERYGLGYTTQAPLTNFTLGENTDIQQIAVVDFTLGSLTDYPGYYLNDDGQISTSKYLHDGEYYQQFSYVTYSDQSKNYYEDVMRRLVHPLGFKNFGGVRIEQNIKSKVKFSQSHTPVKIVYTMPVVAKVLAQTDVIIKHNITKDKNSLPLGPSYASINREKFNYKPFLKYDANKEMNSDTNPNYFGISIINVPSANTPVAAFAKIGFTHPKQIEDLAKQKTNVLADAVVRHKSVVVLDPGAPAGFREEY